MHSLIIGSLTHLHIVVIISQHKHAIDNMKERKEEYMNKGKEKLNMDLSV